MRKKIRIIISIILVIASFIALAYNIYTNYEVGYIPSIIAIIGTIAILIKEILSNKKD